MTTDNGTLTRRAFAGRALAAGASVSTLGPLLAACGGDDDSAGGPATLQFWKFTSDHDDPVIKNAVKTWNQQNPEIQVRFQTFPPEQYVTTKLTTAFTADEGPDIFWIAPGTFINYVNNGIAEPTDDIVDKSGYSDAAIEAVSADGKMYSVPFEQEPVALYYRKDFFDEEGIDPPGTWDELVAAAAALTGGKRKGIVLETNPIPYQAFDWYPFLWSAGAEVVNADSSGSGLRTPEAAAAFDLWGRLVKEGAAPNKLQAQSSDIAPLGNGEAAMQPCGFWAIAQFESDFPDVEYGVAPIPAPAGGEPATVYGGWTQMINSKGHVEQAKAFTEWLWFENDKFPKLWACEHNTKFSPREQINEECAPVFDKPPLSTFKDEILPTARAQPRYPDQVVNAVVDGLQAAMFGGKSGEQAASAAADAIDDFLSSYQGAPLNPEA